MLTVPDDLDELSRIALSDQKTFVAAATASDQRSWLYYFPFLYGFAQGATQTLLWEVFDGAICLYYLRLREEVLYLDLFLPPYPFSPKALKHAQGRLREFNERKTTRIMWVDDAQKGAVGECGFDFRAVEAEYIYDSEPIREANGPEFYRLRRNLSKARRIPTLENSRVPRKRHRALSRTPQVLAPPPAERPRHRGLGFHLHAQLRRGCPFLRRRHHQG